MNHEGIHRNLRTAGRGQRPRLQMAAFTEKAAEGENAAALFGELQAKPAIACIHVLLAEIFNLANRSPLQVTRNASCHPQLITARTPSVSLFVLTCSTATHERSQQ